MMRKNFLTEMPEMTGVLVGEGEKDIPRSSRILHRREGTALEIIRGIAYRDGEEIRA